MAWRIELSELAQRNLRDLERGDAQRILRFLQDRVSALEDPRSIGEALRGARLGQFWEYRVGDYRVIADIEDRRLLILVVRIGHRRQVYRP